MIATDSQSSLTAFNPLKRPKFGKLDISPMINAHLHLARRFNMQLHFQWVPAHIGIQPNEDVDNYAQQIRQNSTLEMQLQHPIEPASLKTFLHQYELHKFHSYVLSSSHNHTGQRFLCCGTNRTNFKARTGVPRPLQCLFSRWRLGQVDSCGSYSRHLGFTEGNCSLCHFCSTATESPLHLCTTCPAFTSYRNDHNISLSTLSHDSSTNILAIAGFDEFISRITTFINPPPIQAPLSRCLETARKRKASSHDTTTPEPTPKRTHPNERNKNRRKRHLIIPSTPLSSGPPPKKQKD
jgi:hypothetical protein